MSDIGKKISDRRKQLGLTLEEVGDAVGVGKSTVRKWENGIIKNMRMDKVHTLANVLQMNYTDLIPGELSIRKYGKIDPDRRIDLDFKMNMAQLNEMKLRREIESKLGIPVIESVSINDKDFQEMVNFWNNATPKKRKEIVRVVGAMVKEE